MTGANLHSLRHTCATLQLMAGEPYQKVSKWLAHATFVVTLTFYAHWVSDKDKESTLDFATRSRRSAGVEQARANGGNRGPDDNVIPLRVAR